MKILIFVLFFIFSTFFCFAENSRSSAPFISGDTFRESSDFIFDELTSDFDCDEVKKGDLIFVKTDFIGTFFYEKHPFIKSPYILITHNSDYGIPGPYAHMLDDEKLIAWFGQNVEGSHHEKLISIPIGVANSSWDHGNIKIVKHCIAKKDCCQRDILLYMNFSNDTCPDVRNDVFYRFINRPFCTYAPRKAFDDYLTDLARVKFVLSPRGNGLDCLRTWEALYMGAIPIVMTSSLDSLFDDLPVLIVSNWDEITREFLEQKWNEMQAKTYNMKKLKIQYWLRLISSKSLFAFLKKDET